MREFFQGWRRKMGCIALVMACVVMIGWLRSCNRCELIFFASSDRQHAVLAIDDGLSWMGWNPTEIKKFAPFDDWQSYEANEFPSIKTSLGAIRTLDSLKEWHVPWPLVVIPLTLLSAYLILWKPRKRKTPDQLTNPNINSN
jgi:hypothetical protein